MKTSLIAPECLTIKIFGCSNKCAKLLLQNRLAIQIEAIACNEVIRTITCINSAGNNPIEAKKIIQN
jgi:hypothetical protein